MNPIVLLSEYLRGSIHIWMILLVNSFWRLLLIVCFDFCFSVAYFFKKKQKNGV